MLYVSTRDPARTHTARTALLNTRASDGGFFVPASLEPLEEPALQELTGGRFGAAVAGMLNHLFGAEMTEHDVRLAVGRNPVRLNALANRILMGECWHNLEGTMDCLTRNLLNHFCPDASRAPGSWGVIGVGISVLFGIFSELMGVGMVSQDRKADISLVSGDFSMAMSAWYARQLGLPIGSIVCCCNENNAVWNLFTHGMLRTDGVSLRTLTPDADICIPDSLERLIYACAGEREVCRYVDRCRRGESYYPDDLLLSRLRKGMFVSVVSTPRMRDTIPNAYTTHGYVLSPYAALAYGGLMDYRAVTGESRRGLILAEKSPLADRELVSLALDISPEELERLVTG